MPDLRPDLTTVSGLKKEIYTSPAQGIYLYS